MGFNSAFKGLKVMLCFVHSCRCIATSALKRLSNTSRDTVHNGVTSGYVQQIFSSREFSEWF
jgi:hypothetical protein